jgi:hypothetical protein
MSEITGVTQVDTAPSVVTPEVQSDDYKQFLEAFRQEGRETLASGLETFQPAPQETLGFWDSAIEATQEFSTSSAVYQAGADRARKSWDMDWVEQDYVLDREKFFQDDEILSNSIREMKELQGDDFAANQILTSLGNSINSDEGRFYINKWQMYKDMQKIAGADSNNWGYSLGILGALMGDASIVGLLTAPFGGLQTTAAATAVMSAAKFGMRSRWATAALVDASVDAWARGQYDPGFTNEQAALQMGLAPFIGAGLAVVIPKLTRRTTKIDAEEEVTRHLDDQAARESIGAARVEEESPYGKLEHVEAAKGFGTLPGVKQLLDTTVLKWARSPKEVWKDFVAFGQKLRDSSPEIRDPTTGKLIGRNLTPLALAVSNVSAIGARIVRLTAFTKNNLLGESALPTMEEGMKTMRQKLGAHRETVGKLVGDFQNQHFKLASLQRAAGALSHKISKMPTVEDFQWLATKLAVARDNATRFDTDIAKAQESVAKNPENARATRRLERLLDKKAKSEKALDEVRESINKFGGENNATDLEALHDVITKVADEDDKWYMELGQKAADAGLIDGKYLRPGYRMQNWNIDAIGKDAAGFKRMLATQIIDDPSPEFLEKWYADRKVDLNKPDEAGEVVGTDLDALEELDPVMYDNMLRDWEQQGLTYISEMYDDAIANLHYNFGDEVETAVQMYKSKAESEITRRQKIIDRQTEQLEKLRSTKPKMRHIDGSWVPVDPKRAQKETDLVRKIGKNEMHRDDWAKRLDEINESLGSLEDMAQLLANGGRKVNSISDFRVRAAERQKERAVARLDAGSDKALMANAFHNKVDEMYNAIIGQRGIQPFEAEDLIQTSKHFKNRGIDLSGIHHTDKVQKFLEQGQDGLMEAYSESVSRQLELEEKFGTFLRNEGLLAKGDFKIADALENYARREFLKAEKGLSGDELKEVQAVRDMLVGAPGKRGLLGKQLAEFTRADRTKIYNSDRGELYDRSLSIAGSLTSAMILGRVLLTLPMDIAMVAFAGGRFLTGMSGLVAQTLMAPFSRKGVMMQNLKELDRLQSIVLRGEHILSGANLRNQYDPDAAPLYEGGSKLRSMQLAGAKVNTLSNWANGMAPWNMFVRRVVAADVAMRLLKDSSGNISPSMRRAYANAGMGTDDFKALKLLKENSDDINDGYVKLKNTQQWDGLKVHFDDNGNATLLRPGDDIPTRKVTTLIDGVPTEVDSTIGRVVDGAQIRANYLRTIENLSNQMHLDPSIGDRPFWKADLHGRVLMMFQSFMYAAQERFIGPAMQELMLSPLHSSGRVATAMFMGVGLGYVSNLVRAKLNDDDTPETRILEGNEKRGDWNLVMQHAVRRSPLMVGFSDRLLETFMVSGLSKSLNEATGYPVVDEQSFKYRHNKHILSPISGPMFSTIGRAGKVVTESTERDIGDTLEQAQKITPIANSLLFQVIGRFYDHNN